VKANSWDPRENIYVLYDYRFRFSSIW